MGATGGTTVGALAGAATAMFATASTLSAGLGFKIGSMLHPACPHVAIHKPCPMFTQASDEEWQIGKRLWRESAGLGVTTGKRMRKEASSCHQLMMEAYFSSGVWARVGKCEGTTEGGLKVPK